ncbi:hypothetical protein BSKO_03905 [Bryopsis sp. KO-2023]|nr:hypothetical protein BSKO_03905 [Bryopsis sp. KO-2023]
MAQGGILPQLASLPNTGVSVPIGRRNVLGSLHHLGISRKQAQANQLRSRASRRLTCWCVSSTPGTSLQILPQSSDGFVCSVRTMFQTKWCCLEMIGTLKGGQAERVAQLAVHQEYYRNRGKTLLALVKYAALQRPDNLPFSKEKLKKIKKEEEAGNFWASMRLNTNELIALAVDMVGPLATTKALATAISKCSAEAQTLCDGASPKILTETTRVCSAEMFSRVKARQKAISKEPESEDDGGFNWDQVAFKIGLEIRRTMYEMCTQALLDLLVDFADSSEEIVTPKLDESPCASVTIRGGPNMGFDERISFRASGPGVKRLREQMARDRWVVKLREENPFEGVEEKDMMASFVRFVQSYLRMPVPERAWFSAEKGDTEGSDMGNANSGSEEEEEVDMGREIPDRPGHFRGLRIMCMRVPKYKWVKLEPAELMGLIYGLSEYICDDFGIRSRGSSGKKCRRYPSDAPVRICWTPDTSSIELLALDGSLCLELSGEKVDDLRQICDEVIRRIPDFVRLSPPPRPPPSKNLWGVRWGSVWRTTTVVGVVLVAGFGLVRSGVVGGRSPPGSPISTDTVAQASMINDVVNASSKDE